MHNGDSWQASQKAGKGVTSAHWTHGGLSVAELRPVLIASGESANEAREVVEQYDANGDGELSKDELMQAWERDGRKPIHIKDK